MLPNLVKHGLDFAHVEEGFDFGTAIALETSPSRNGRRRIRMIGEMNGILLVAMIVSPLGSEALSIISLRTASKKECELYGW
ncbi:BrnT family toxin [Labrys sp. (in: a-proteobacteria)]|uniref:BrnT family toxin n=1 Tax=Labrys sp. (in: a-proteobacteria) TaxID=1917972 RepID=UPI0039E2CDBE